MNEIEEHKKLLIVKDKIKEVEELGNDAPEEVISATNKLLAWINKRINQIEQANEQPVPFEKQFPNIHLSPIKALTAANADGIKSMIINNCKDNQSIIDAVGTITFVRGITPECNIHNSVNRERQRILTVLGLMK